MQDTKPNLDFDLHSHTFHSPCGRDEMVPVEMVRLAIERGITRLGVTDHFYPTTDSGIYDQVRADFEDALAGRNGALRVFIGCEAEVMAPGRVAGGPDLAERLDYVMVGATHFQNVPLTQLPPGDDEFRAGYYLEMFIFGVSLTWADIMAHPFFVVPSACSPSILKHIRKQELLTAIELAKENNVAMEISRRVFTTPEQFDFSLSFYSLCKRVGLKFTLGSDAHELKDLGQIHLLEPLVTELGLTEADFWMPNQGSRD